MAKFCIGDTVQLMSGGPEMTVQFIPITSTESVECCWFDVEQKHNVAIFHISTLAPSNKANIQDREIIEVDGIKFKQLDLFKD